MRTVRNIIEWGGSILGFVWLFGPPAWQPINRGVTIALLITLGIVVIFVAALMVAIAQSQREPSYFDRPENRY